MISFRPAGIRSVCAKTSASAMRKAVLGKRSFGVPLGLFVCFAPLRGQMVWGNGEERLNWPGLRMTKELFS